PRPPLRVCRRRFSECPCPSIARGLHWRSRSSPAAAPCPRLGRLEDFPDRPLAERSADSWFRLRRFPREKSKRICGATKDSCGPPRLPHAHAAVTIHCGFLPRTFAKLFGYHDRHESGDSTRRPSTLPAMAKHSAVWLVRRGAHNPSEVHGISVSGGRAFA